MKLNELFEGEHKQWKNGDVVIDRSGKVQIVDKQDGVKVFMKGQSHGHVHVHPNNLKPVDPEIVDAVKAVGTVDELPQAYDKIQHFLFTLGRKSEGDLKAFIDKTNGQDKFALRVAMKVLGLRDLTEALQATAYFVTSIADDFDKPNETIEKAVSKLCKKYGIEAKYLRTPSHSGGWPEYLFWGPRAKVVKFAFEFAWGKDNDFYDAQDDVIFSSEDEAVEASKH